MRRGEIYWAQLPEPVGAGPGYLRPALVVQSDQMNASRLPTVVICSLSSNLRLSRYPGNLLLRADETGLGKDSVLRLTEVLTVDRSVLGDLAGRIPDHLMVSVDNGLREVLGL